MRQAILLEEKTDVESQIFESYGQVSPKWSASDSAAIRVWSQAMAADEKS